MDESNVFANLRRRRSPSLGAEVLDRLLVACARAYTLQLSRRSRRVRAKPRDSLCPGLSARELDRLVGVMRRVERLLRSPPAGVEATEFFQDTATADRLDYVVRMYEIARSSRESFPRARRGRKKKK